MIYLFSIVSTDHCLRPNWILRTKKSHLFV